MAPPWWRFSVLLRCGVRNCNTKFTEFSLSQHIKFSNSSSPIYFRRYLEKLSISPSCFQSKKGSTSLFVRKLTHSAMMAKVREDHIESSPEDKRKYRGVTLNNGLKVMLISDTVTDKSAVSLDVHIGSMSDPVDLPGLAHFCEHMLFMGTEKFPVENDYNEYLSTHSGSCNAYTMLDHTNYHFDVAPDAFAGALDRFAQFFIAPLFTESAVGREVNAVHSEYEKNIQSDLWRLSQLEKSTVDPTHDFAKFNSGNKETLETIPKEKGINVREALLEFHKKWYSSNIMSLAVLGIESLDELEEMVTNLFDVVTNRNVEIPSWEVHPFSDEYCRKMIKFVPVKDIRHLHISFPIPDYQSFYKTSPGHYLGHFIGHEGPGSLLSFLKDKGWVNTLIGGQKSGAKGFAFFVVNVDLTEEGMEHVHDIVSAVFQYLNLLKEEGPQMWAFEECRDINALSFRFKDKEKPQSYVCSVAENMHLFPLAEALSGGYTLSEFNCELIASLLDRLVTDKIRIAFVGKALEDQVDQEEKWYGTRYKMEDIDDDVLKLWKTLSKNEMLHLPSKNEFIATNFELYGVGETVSDVPVLMEETPFYRVWHKLDTEFNLPKTSIFAEFFSRMAYLDPNHTNLLYMFVQLFRDSLTEYTYAAELAGLYYILHNTKFGLTLNVQGYNDKQEVLLQKIIDKLLSFKVNRKRFEIIKDSYVRALKNFAADQPHHHLVYYTSLLLSEQGWSKEELLSCVDELTVENLETFIPRFLSNLHLEFLIHGNVTREKAERLYQIVTTQLVTEAHTRPLLPSQLARQREYQLPSGCSLIYRSENSIHRSSAVETFYQFGQMGTHENMLAELLVQIFSEPAFNELRNKEQLGYIVWCGLRRSNGTQGLRLIIQGDKSPEYLDSRIEAFLLKMKETLNSMTEEEFLRHRESLAKRRLEQPKKLSHLTSQWWFEIMFNQYHFLRDQVEVDHLRSITKEDILSFYGKKVDFEANERRKLSVQVLSVAAGGAGDTETHATDVQPDDELCKPPTLKEPELIEGIPSFKESLPLYPLMKPYIPITKDSRSKL